MEQTGGGWTENIFDLIRENDIESIRSLVETFKEDMDDEFNKINEQGQTPLHVAITQRQTDGTLGNLEICQLLINGGADVNIQDNDGDSPLLDAFKVNIVNLNIIRLLVETPNINVNIVDRNGRTALHLASGNGLTPVVQLLIDAGADLNKEDDGNRTPLHYASLEGYIEIVQYLIDAGADVNKGDDGNRSPLHLSVYEGNKTVLEQLIKAGADVNKGDSTDSTPLHYAVYMGNKALVEQLIAAGADLNKGGDFGRTPLHYATDSGNERVIKYLIDAGSDVNMLNNSNQSPLIIAIEADEVNIDLIKLLIDTGANINFKDSQGDSPLILAGGQEDLELMRVLLNTPNINVNIVDRYGRTALHQAIISSNIEMCRLLIEYGADVNIQDNNGDTPLLKAFKVNEFNLEIVRLLVDRGAYININDNNNKNVFFYAEIYDNEELIDILKNGRIKDLYQKRYSFVPRNFTKGKPRQGGSKRRKSKKSKRSKKSKKSKRSKRK